MTRGDRVGFQAPDGRMLEGTVLRLNKKSISIATDDGHPLERRARSIAPRSISRRRPIAMIRQADNFQKTIKELRRQLERFCKQKKIDHTTGKSSDKSRQDQAE